MAQPDSAAPQPDVIFEFSQAMAAINQALFTARKFAPKGVELTTEEIVVIRDNNQAPELIQLGRAQIRLRDATPAVLSLFEAHRLDASPIFRFIRDAAVFRQNHDHSAYTGALAALDNLRLHAPAAKPADTNQNWPKFSDAKTILRLQDYDITRAVQAGELRADRKGKGQRIDPSSILEYQQKHPQPTTIAPAATLSATTPPAKHRSFTCKGCGTIYPSPKCSCPNCAGSGFDRNP